MPYESFSENPFAWAFIEATGIILYFLGLSRLSLLLAFTAIIGAMWFRTSRFSKESTRRVRILGLVGIGVVGFLAVAIASWHESHRPGFVLLYDGQPLNGKVITLATPNDPTVRQIRMYVATNVPNVFIVTGIIARNDADVPVQPDAAYLSFAAQISKLQLNSGAWLPSPDRKIEGWTTYRTDFGRGLIEPEHSAIFEDFQATPIPSEPLRTRITLIYGQRETAAEFIIKSLASSPPSSPLASVASDAVSSSSPSFWRVSLNELINLLLTAAIGWAAWMQWHVARRLLTLQDVIEKQHTRVWLFVQLKPTTEGGHETAKVQVSNLSQVGVWLEEIVPFVNGQSAKPIPVKKIVGNLHEDLSVDIRGAVTELAGPSAGRVDAKAYVEVKFWAYGQWQPNARTPIYSMKIDSNHITQVTESST